MSYKEAYFMRFYKTSNSVCYRGAVIYISIDTNSTDKINPCISVAVVIHLTRITVVSPHQLKHTILRGSRAARYLLHALVASMAYPKPYIRSRTYGEKRSGYRDFGNRSSLELLATEIDSGLRRSRAKLCALIDVETPLSEINYHNLR